MKPQGCTHGVYIPRVKRGPDLDVFAYVDYREFLDAWFTAQKNVDSRFSHRHFARKAGVRSPSLLKEVIAGRRNLTPTTLEGFVQACRLKGEAAQFFRALVQFDQSETDEDRREAWVIIAASRRFRSAQPIEGAMMEYLTHWYIPATRELALCGDLEDDPSALSKRLFPSISVAEAKAALSTLKQLGMLVEEGGFLVAKDVSVATPHQLVAFGVRRYHTEMLTRAIDSLVAVPQEERHVLGLTVAIPQSLMPTLKAELDAVQERLLHICDEQAQGADRVYQVNLNLIPLSRGS